jgi:hypothetical protein
MTRKRRRRWWRGREGEIRVAGREDKVEACAYETERGAIVVVGDVKVAAAAAVMVGRRRMKKKKKKKKG